MQQLFIFRCHLRLCGTAHRKYTSSIIGETTLQTIAWKLMSIGRCQHNITSKSGIGDLSHNIFVGLETHVSRNGCMEYWGSNTQLARCNQYNIVHFKNWRQHQCEGLILAPPCLLNTYKWSDSKEKKTYILPLTLDAENSRPTFSLSL